MKKFRAEGQEQRRGALAGYAGQVLYHAGAIVSGMEAMKKAGQAQNRIGAVLQRCWVEHHAREVAVNGMARVQAMTDIAEASSQVWQQKVEESASSRRFNPVLCSGQAEEILGHRWLL